MLKKSPLSIFKGKQGYMYAVALLAWDNYISHQEDFAKNNSKYTKELAEEQQAAIEAARQQPNVKQRREVPQEAREGLGKAAAELRNVWQLLSSLIENSFAQDVWELKKTAAGGNYYLPSSKNNWSATFDMGEAAAEFLTLNTEALTAGGMLPTFPQQLADAKKKYDGLYGTYYNTKQTAKDGTKKKTGANNTVYKTTMSMLKDGVKYFRNNPDVREKFVYASLMKTVSGKGFTKTGYEFIVKDSVTHLPVTTAAVVFTDEDNNSYTGKLGKSGILRCEMPAGAYNYVLKAPGYATLIGTVKAVEGSMRRKTLKLREDAGSNNLPQQSKAV